jgi:hypothetical protein
MRLPRLNIFDLVGVGGCALAFSEPSILIFVRSASRGCSSALTEVCMLFLAVLFLRRLPRPRIDFLDDRPEATACDFGESTEAPV